MKKIVCLLLAAALLSMTACREEVSPPAVESPPAVNAAAPEVEVVQGSDDLFWTTAVEPVQIEINGTVEGTTETYIRELSSEKYQGRAVGSEGNRLAADWLAEQFERIGLQKLPDLDSWKQNYPHPATAVLPGEAALVAPDGSETELVLGEDWMFRASPEAVDAIVSLTADETFYKENSAIWDAYAVSKNSSKRLSLTVGEMTNGISYSNANGTPSRLQVTESVYEQLKQEGWKLHLNLPDAIDEEGTADNVIGYLPGRDPTKAVVLGANFDGAGQCGPLLMAGAYSNASGVAALLQTAEWLTQAEELPCDVIFAAFNADGAEVVAEQLAEQYTQVRMVNLKCIGWKDQPLTIYGDGSEATLRNSLAGGLKLQYADRSVGADDRAFCNDSMSGVALFQDACINNDEIAGTLNSIRDVADNLDFSVLDKTAKKLAEWIVERGDEPLKSYILYW